MADAYRLLMMLEKKGLIGHAAMISAYSLRPPALLRGASAWDQGDIGRLTATHLAALGGCCNGGLVIRVCDGLETVCVARFEPTEVPEAASRAGSRRPLHAGASGKLLLAHAEEEVRAQVLGRALTRYTCYTHVDAAVLGQELHRIRQRGYSESYGEIVPGCAAIAVPVRCPGGEVIAALSASCRDSRAQPRRMSVLLAYLLDGALILSDVVGAAIRGLNGGGAQEQVQNE